MRFTSLFGASLLLASAANAIPAAVAKTSSTSTLPTAASTNTAVAAAQLEDLLLDAIKVANNSLKDAGSKRSTGCTLQNVSIRREWYCSSAHAYPPLPVINPSVQVYTFLQRQDCLHQRRCVPAEQDREYPEQPRSGCQEPFR